MILSNPHLEFYTLHISLNNRGKQTVTMVMGTKYSIFGLKYMKVKWKYVK